MHRPRRHNDETERLKASQFEINETTARKHAKIVQTMPVSTDGRCGESSCSKLRQTCQALDIKLHEVDPQLRHIENKKPYQGLQFVMSKQKILCALDTLEPLSQVAPSMHRQRCEDDTALCPSMSVAAWSTSRSPPHLKEPSAEPLRFDSKCQP